MTLAKPAVMWSVLKLPDPGNRKPWVVIYSRTGGMTWEFYQSDVCNLETARHIADALAATDLDLER